MSVILSHSRERMLNHDNTKPCGGSFFRGKMMTPLVGLVGVLGVVGVVGVVGVR